MNADHLLVLIGGIHIEAKLNRHLSLSHCSSLHSPAGISLNIFPISWVFYTIWKK